MLRLENIRKEYKVADLKVEALKGISLAFRKNEFVSILGPSGCGKTTTLNIIGGLDKYTKGDLFINGKSTKDFSDHDWDVYRNHRVGFIFQSYNLIPHETILENVSLALTIAGVNRAEREKKAKEALDKVGLKGQYNKKPNQLSGGQCQRVAIARALVNEPEILLADEPTGALDTKTSVQIMDLIKEISRDKLVIMVTHNPDLAKKYSTRIISLLDGEVQDDTNPYSFEEEMAESFSPIQNEKAKMSWWTSFKLSSKNLWSKKKRTILVSIAGSIGIIGVSSVLSISTGVNDYITNMQDDMLSGNPIQISESSYDLSSIMSLMSTAQKTDIAKGVANKVNVQYLIDQIMDTIGKQEKIAISNDLSSDYVKFVLDMPKEYYSDITLKHGYELDNNIYTSFTKEKLGTSNYSLSSILDHYQSVLANIEGFDAQSSSYLTSLVNSVSEMPASNEYISKQYDILDGALPQNENEILLVLDKNEFASDLILAQLGFLSESEFVSIAKNSKAIAQGETGVSHNNDISVIDYSKITGHKLYYAPNDSIYESTGLGNYTTNRDGLEQTVYYPTFNYLYELSDEVISNNPKIKELRISGIVKPKNGVSYGSLKSGFYYTNALASEHYENTKEEIDNNTIDNLSLNAKANEKTLNFSSFVDFYTKNIGSISNNESMHIVTYNYKFYNYSKDEISEAIGYVGQSNQMASLVSSMDSTGMLAKAIGGKTITARYIGDASSPSTINIYPNSFDEKGMVTSYLDKWNSEEDLTLSDNSVILAADRNKVTYTDNVGVIISMVRTLINIVTTALIAFTALSLVVSCFMIAIITYVSVMERVKEIGVIRSLGGRKKDVTHLFNAETFIIGASSGAIGLIVTGLLGLFFNILMSNLAGVSNISTLYLYHIVIMMILSIGLTVLSGAIPSRSAAKHDPVEALRSE